MPISRPLHARVEIGAAYRSTEEFRLVRVSIVRLRKGPICALIYCFFGFVFFLMALHGSINVLEKIGLRHLYSMRELVTSTSELKTT